MAMERPSFATKRSQRPTQMDEGRRTDVKVRCECLKR